MKKILLLSFVLFATFSTVRAQKAGVAGDKQKQTTQTSNAEPAARRAAAAPANDGVPSAVPADKGARAQAPKAAAAATPVQGGTGQASTDTAAGKRVKTQPAAPAVSSQEEKQKTQPQTAEKKN